MTVASAFAVGGALVFASAFAVGGALVFASAFASPYAFAVADGFAVARHHRLPLVIDSPFSAAVAAASSALANSRA